MNLIESLANTLETRPFDHLGVHKLDKSWVIRTWHPQAISISVFDYFTDKLIGEMTKADDRGLFVLESSKSMPTYYFKISYPDADDRHVDPYQFGDRAFEDFTHKDFEQYKNLGAQLCSVTLGVGKKAKKIQGVRFAVYAPNARTVSLVGNFNHWNGNRTPMSSHTDGIWRIFIPEMQIGELYKYEIKDRNGQVLPHKSDPMSFYTEQYPSFSSQVYDQNAYQWQDDAWQSRPQPVQHESAMNIYEVHVMSWRQKSTDSGTTPLSWRELAEELVNYVVDMGYTHLELLPITEFPLDDSWGYQPLNLFSPTSRLGTADDFKFFVDQCHKKGIAVILDWVPAHFPSDAHGLAKFDGSCIYEYEDPQKGWHPDWKSYIYDYGKSSVCNFLLSSALFWLEKYHIDGIRVDAVASMLYLDYSRDDGQWTPNVEGGNLNLEAISFLKNLNMLVYQHFPKAVTIAEESTAFPGVSTPIDHGGLGFGFKWNMGWMHDTLLYFSTDPLYRQYHYEQLCFSFVYCFDENFVLPLSHDEVVHGKKSLLGKMPGDMWQSAANARALAAWQFAHPGKKLNFMGNEFAQGNEWNFRQSLDWHLLDYDRHQGIHKLHKDLNHLYKAEQALYETDSNGLGFKWIERAGHERSVVAFQRFDKKLEQVLLVIANLTPQTQQQYHIGVEYSGTYKVVINTDSAFYNGSDFEVGQHFMSENTPAQAYGQSICIDLPPLATLILKKVDQIDHAPEDILTLSPKREK